VLPNPATAAACNPACIAPNSGLAFPFRFSATLTIQETGGVGGNVDFVNVTGQHGGRTFGTINFGSDLIVQRVGTNHVSARGTLSFAFSIDFDNQDGSTHDRLETANIQLTDDRGNRITSTIQFNVI